MDLYQIPYWPDGTGPVTCMRCGASGRYSAEAGHCFQCGTPLRIVEVLSETDKAMLDEKMVQLIHNAGCSSLPVSLLRNDR